MRTIRLNLNRKFINTTKFRCSTKKRIEKSLTNIQTKEKEIEIVDNYFNINLDLSNNITDEMPREGIFGIINRIIVVYNYIIKYPLKNRKRK